MKTFAILLLSSICFFTSQAQPYKKLHQQSILVDAHNDFPTTSIEKKALFEGNLKGKTHTDLDRLIQGGVDVQIFSVWCDGLQQKPFDYANRQIDSIHAWVMRNPSKMSLVRTPRQLEQALKTKKLVTMIGVEGGHMIEDNLANLDSLSKRGVSYLTITHNNSTSWASSAKDETSNAPELQHRGLNDFGKQVIRRMNELGMLVDVSHAGEQTFWDILHTSTKPIIASHSSAWSLVPHRRNLKDEQLKAIAENGGIIHVNFYAGFLDSSYENHLKEFVIRHQKEINDLAEQNIQKDYAITMIAEKYSGEIHAFQPTLSALLDHIDHIVKIAGIDHVGLGSDFDGIEASVIEMTGVQDFPLLTKGLMERGYRQHDIKKILGLNFLRVLKANHSK